MEGAPALDQVRTAFAEKVLEGYDNPTINTIDQELYQKRPFRYYLDNLLSILYRVHKEHRAVMRGLGTTDDLISKEFDRFVKLCKNAKDEHIARIFHSFAMVKSPRVAWWVASSSDWIENVPREQIDFSAVATSSTARTIPALPIAIIYKEAMELRKRAESDPDVMAPEDALLAMKVAKYLYATMKESITIISPDPDQGETARIKQCTRKLTVITSSLEEATGEDEDFIDIILGAIPNNTIGPDGQRLSTKTIKKGLSSALNTGVLFDIVKAIPEALNGATDEQSAKDNLLNNPSVKKILQAGGKEASVGQIFDFMKGYGIIPTGESTSAPIDTTGGAAPSASSQSSSAPGPKVRKSVKK
jgi:hypothetical protein